MTNEKQEAVAAPEGATHQDSGPSSIEWIRVSENVHDYWEEAEKRWVTFEGGHVPLRSHWNAMQKEAKG